MAYPGWPRNRRPGPTPARRPGLDLGRGGARHSTGRRGRGGDHVDMVGVLVDFESGIARLTEQGLSMHRGRFDEVLGVHDARAAAQK